MDHSSLLKSKVTGLTKGYGYHIIAVLTVIVWGTTFVSTKVLIGYGLTPADILFYRFILAYIGIWFFSPRVLWAKSWKDELLLVTSGLCGGSLYFIAENSALGITLASNVSLIITTTPILTAFLTWMFYKEERLKSSLIYGSLMALFGVALVVFNGGFILKINPLGDILTLIAALLWAFYGIILRCLDKHYSTLFITRKIFFYGIVTLLPVFCFKPLNTDLKVLFDPLVISNLLYLGLVASMLCYIMWNITISKLGVVRTTNYIYVVPLVTLLTSALIINEKITGVALLGSVFILGGVYLAEKGFTFLFHRNFHQ